MNESVKIATGIHVAFQEIGKFRNAMPDYIFFKITVVQKQNLALTRCNILIHPHFPVHILGAHKRHTGLDTLVCAVPHLTCTVRPRGCSGTGQVSKIARVGQ